MEELLLTDSPNTSGKLDMNYAANTALVMVFLLLGYAAWLGLTSVAIGPANHFLIICLMALTISIVYVGLQISRVAGKLR